VPEWIDPVGVLLDHHSGTSVEAKPAIVTDRLSHSLDYVVTWLGSYMIPESFICIDQLPRTTLLKIDRRAQRNRPDDANPRK
jgi:acyl-coenzyme A synthetase/AMP-(fatty) acid ligase